MTTTESPRPPAPTTAGDSPRVFRRFAVNVASLFSVHMANMLLPLLTVPYLVRVIGPERLGLLSFSQAYITYFTLLINYGFEMAAVRAIAARREDKAFVSQIFSEVMAGKTLLWALSTIIFAGVTLGVPSFREHLWLHVCTYLSCVGIVLFPIWLYQAMEDLGRVAVCNLAVKLLFTLAVFAFIRRPDDYIYQNLSISVAQVLVSIGALYVGVRRFHVTFAWPSWARLGVRFREDSTIFFSSLMITIYASSNVFILGLMSDPYRVGIFAAGTRLESLARSFVGLALNQAFFPIVAHAFGKGRDEGMRVVRTTVFPVLIGLGLLSLGLAAIARPFILILYGERFRDAIPILRIVAVLTLTIGLSNLLGFHTMLNLRMDRAFFVITAIGSVLGIALNIILIHRYQDLGAAWAWVIAELYITVAMYIYLSWRGYPVLQRSYFHEAVAFTRARVQSIFS